MRKNYFAKLVRYMKNVYHIESGLNKLFDGRVNPTYYQRPPKWYTLLMKLINPSVNVDSATNNT
ncbi:MAG: hypothetical protein P4L59_10545 [Desulfosporosinus sp.]|nr:hypothetical protein [Desulfosporosinus sp.]